MIKAKNAKSYCCEDISLIENYEQAVADTENIWECHHRGEILPCGTYRVSDLKKFGLYWKRPASELIFLRQDEHRKLHSVGKNNPNFGRKFSEDVRRNMSEAHIGNKGFWVGKHRSDETKKKISETIRKYWEEKRKKV